jgi:hypothetical protein
MQESGLFFDWETLNRYPFEITSERKSRCRDIISTAAVQYNNIKYADMGPENFLESPQGIRIHFFPGFNNGTYGFSKDGREHIGFNYTLLDFYGTLMCCAFHEFSHCYDYRKKLTEQEDSAACKRSVESEIRAYERELKFLDTIPKYMWQHGDTPEARKVHIDTQMERNKNKLFLINYFFLHFSLMTKMETAIHET